MDKISIAQDRIEFQKEQDHLLKTILDVRYFQPWKRRVPTERDEVPKGSLELFLTPTCNQKCEYCYLQKYPDLYPAEINNKETIITNLKKILDWCIKEEFLLPNLDLFSGEIWHTNYGLEILDIVYDYIVNKGLMCLSVTIPTNGTFFHNPKQIVEIQNRLDNFKAIQCPITISFSVDGKYVEDEARPLNDKTLVRDDAFYDRLFTFAKHNEYGFHPMLAACSAKDWVKNFDWWVTMLRKYDLPMDRLMLLEVRNNDWTEETIKDYQQVIRHIFEFTWDYYEGNIPEVLNDLILYNQVYETKTNKRDDLILWGEKVSYIPITTNETKGFYGCTISTHLTVRVGDLAICPCHRSAYNKYLYGKFTLDEHGEIAGVQANNPQLAVNILMLDNRKAVLGCDSCILNDICLGTCKGQSIESCSDPLRNDPIVCNFLQKKYEFIFDLYEEKGIMTWLEENCTKYHATNHIWSKYVRTWQVIKEEREYAKLAEFRQNFYGRCNSDGDN